ncbi:MAG TPA: hypothetical protein VMM38_08330 [Aridibacter sp.]|nr:hypothetical protein [Aridibacter sp.]
MKETTLSLGKRQECLPAVRKGFENGWKSGPEEVGFGWGKGDAASRRSASLRDFKLQISNYRKCRSEELIPFLKSEIAKRRGTQRL